MPGSPGTFQTIRVCLQTCVASNIVVRKYFHVTVFLGRCMLHKYAHGSTARGDRADTIDTMAAEYFYTRRIRIDGASVTERIEGHTQSNVSTSTMLKVSAGSFFKIEPCSKNLIPTWGPWTKGSRPLTLYIECEGAVPLLDRDNIATKPLANRFKQCHMKSISYS